MTESKISAMSVLLFTTCYMVRTEEGARKKQMSNRRAKLKKMESVIHHTIFNLPFLFFATSCFVSFLKQVISET
jgi:hypothetical protein